MSGSPNSTRTGTRDADVRGVILIGLVPTRPFVPNTANVWFRQKEPIQTNDRVRGNRYSVGGQVTRRKRSRAGCSKRPTPLVGDVDLGGAGRPRGSHAARVSMRSNKAAEPLHIQRRSTISSADISSRVTRVDDRFMRSRCDVASVSHQIATDGRRSQASCGDKDTLNAGESGLRRFGRGQIRAFSDKRLRRGLANLARASQFERDGGSAVRIGRRFRGRCAQGRAFSSRSARNAIAGESARLKSGRTSADGDAAACSSRRRTTVVRSSATAIVPVRG